MTSLLPDYVNTIGQQLIQALNDPGQLGIIYQGLTKYISAKYGGSLHLNKLKQQACSRSPIARTLFLLEREFEIHVTTTNRAFPIKTTPLEQTWKKAPTYNNLSSLSKTKTQQHLDKLYMHGITTLAQIQNPDTMGILTPVEFQTRYKQISKAIKTALQQAQTLFPTPPPSTPHTNRPLPPQNINTNTTTTLTPSTQPTLGCAIHNIIQDKTTIRKDKWGAQAIKRSYLCQWRTHNETTQQWRTEENLLHPDNILLDHNLLLITQYHKTKTEHETTQLYKDYTHHSQSKDNKFIHPPLKITNLKISTQERNPDKDIHANKPTIQIQNSMANIHDQNGNYIATLTIERLQWLWNQFSQNNLPHLTP